MKIILVIAVFFVLRDFLAYLFGWGGGETFVDLLSNARHNRKIDREWKENGEPIVETTVGWRPDPVNKNDGFRQDSPDGLNRAGDGHTYSRLIRGGTKEYRARFERDVEESRK